jgi:hypothetical protein
LQFVRSVREWFIVMIVKNLYHAIIVTIIYPMKNVKNQIVITIVVVDFKEMNNIFIFKYKFIFKNIFFIFYQHKQQLKVKLVVLLAMK